MVRGDLLFAACVGFALGIIAASSERIEQDDGDELSSPDPYLTGLTNSGCAPSVAGQGEVPAVSHLTLVPLNDPAWEYAKWSDDNVISIVRKHDGDE